MTSRIFSSVDSMLSVDGLREVLGREVRTVERVAIETEGFSDNHLERIRCTLEDGTDRGFVLKRFDPADWITRLTSDVQYREIAMLEHDWYRALPGECWTPAVSAVRGAEAALLMSDVSEFLFPEGDDPISGHDLEICLLALTALHAAYWEHDSFDDSGVELCTTGGWIGLLTPEVGARRVERNMVNPITEMLEAGWEAFFGGVPRHAADTVRSIQSDPSDFLLALYTSPHTLVHGDAKLANFGIERRHRRLVMLDWALVGYLSPFIELGWFLAVNSARIPIPKEEVIESYRAMLAAHDIRFGQEWDRHLDLGLLAGGTLRLGWIKALGARSDDQLVRTRESAELAWWSEAAERASHHL